jgi:NADPH-dependent ferric siderophore reductase
MAAHDITRIRREPRRRELTVVDTQMLSPRMKRIIFASDELHDFESAAPDDHIKLFIPELTEPDGKLVMRDYTPRAFDPERGTLTIDFALHEAGPATAWALDAGVGSVLTIGGPRSSTVVADDFDWYLLIGDETAIPAIARRVEELRPQAIITCILVTDSIDDRVEILHRSELMVYWVARGKGFVSDDRLVLARLAEWQQPCGDGYIFVAAEASVTSRLKIHFLASGHNPAWLKASGYWVRDALS